MTSQLSALAGGLSFKKAESYYFGFWMVWFSKVRDYYLHLGQLKLWSWPFENRTIRKPDRSITECISTIWILDMSGIQIPLCKELIWTVKMLLLCKSKFDFSWGSNTKHVWILNGWNFDPTLKIKPSLEKKIKTFLLNTMAAKIAAILFLM